MEAHHRKALQENLSALKEGIDLQKIYPYLIKEKIITEGDVENLRTNFPDHDNQATDFFLWYRKRGPKAYSILIASLKAHGYVAQYKLLESYNNGSIAEPNQGDEEHPPITSSGMGGQGDEINEFSDIRGYSSATPHFFRETILEGKEYLQINVRPATQYNEGCVVDAYPMMSRPRGYALIINNIRFRDPHILYRAGAEVDTLNLKHLLEAFGFEVMPCENVEKIHVRDILERFIEQFKHKPVDACFVAVMSHGHENTIQMSDRISSTLDIWDDVVTRFNNRHCSALIQKPKIFLIQSCRGSLVDRGVSRTETDFGVIAPSAGEQIRASPESFQQIQPPARLKREPEFKDILVCYATTPGYVSNRDIISGSWYIRTFCEIFMNGAHNTEIKKLLDRVGRRMEEIESEEGYKQMSSYTSFGFNHDLYFNPGLYG